MKFKGKVTTTYKDGRAYKDVEVEAASVRVALTLAYSQLTAMHRSMNRRRRGLKTIEVKLEVVNAR